MEATTQGPALPSFLLARIAEDEWAAREAKMYGGTLDELAGWVEIGSDRVDKAETHFARWSPARVLAECEAKRLIVKDHPSGNDCWHRGHGDPCWDLRHLAVPYADHPDFREEWRV